MDERAQEIAFSGSVPDVYDRLMVPMIFDVYAADLAMRVHALDPSDVLEVAAGTGAVTRAMAAALPERVAIVATDLSPAMVEHATRVGTVRPVRFETADVMALPFGDASFDVVVCQFGVMFFPDRAAAAREILRVLRPGGTFVFNVWDCIEHNEFAHVVSSAVAELYPDDPPKFMARVPHGYHDGEQIRSDLAAGGFTDAVTIEEVGARSRAATSRDVATAYCSGTPMRNYFDGRGNDALDVAIEAATAAVARAFGDTDLDGAINAFVVSAKVTRR